MTCPERSVALAALLSDQAIERAADAVRRRDEDWLPWTTPRHRALARAALDGALAATVPGDGPWHQVQFSIRVVPTGEVLTPILGGAERLTRERLADLNEDSPGRYELVARAVSYDGWRGVGPLDLDPLSPLTARTWPG